MFNTLSASLKSVSTSMILRGVLAIVIGVIAFGWPGITILALVILFALYAFIDAGLEAARAFSSAAAGPVIGHLLLGLIDLAAGVVAIVWPGPTALVLVLVVGIWAFIGGFSEIFAAFQAGETAGTRALFVIAGLVSAAFGVVLFARPGLGAVTLALLFGLYSFIHGISLITMGIDTRRTAKALHPATSARGGADPDVTPRQPLRTATPISDRRFLRGLWVIDGLVVDRGRPRPARARRRQPTVGVQLPALGNWPGRAPTRPHAHATSPPPSRSRPEASRGRQRGRGG